jgi:ribosomal 50S subunit-associated protein YjgA (DUF615 family)
LEANSIDPLSEIAENIKGKCSIANQLIWKHKLGLARMEPPDDSVIEQLSQKFAEEMHQVNRKFNELERKADGQIQIERIQANVIQLVTRLTGECDHRKQLLLTCKLQSAEELKSGDITEIESKIERLDGLASELRNAKLEVLEQLSVQIGERREEIERLIKHFGLPQASVAVLDLSLCHEVRRELSELLSKLEDQSTELKLRAIRFQRTRVEALKHQWKHELDL